MDNNADNNYVVRVNAYVDPVDCDDFCAHIDTWSDSTLYNGSLSWLKLSSADPDFQCGTFSCSGEASEWVSFDWFFDSPPTVFVGLSKFDIGDNWRASVYASDISETGFTIHAEKWGSTDFYGCAVTWVAVVDGKEGVLCGTFGGDYTTAQGYSGSIVFPAAFDHTPTILTAFQKFDLDHEQNMRVAVSTNTSTTAMDWEIDTWSGSRLYEVEVAYLALDCYY
ncbi:hypothetical protein B0H14DRAFT_3087255 [Mycena olivaceomarginata]|nr:hypothetical protein B0H14DRAFT_3087255 [Mycena olivaceomarginata]